MVNLYKKEGLLSLNLLPTQRLPSCGNCEKNGCSSISIRALPLRRTTGQRRGFIDYDWGGITQKHNPILRGDRQLHISLPISVVSITGSDLLGPFLLEREKAYV